MVVLKNTVWSPAGPVDGVNSGIQLFQRLHVYLVLSNCIVKCGNTNPILQVRKHCIQLGCHGNCLASWVWSMNTQHMWLDKRVDIRKENPAKKKEHTD